jgi:hypothetical protein
MNFGLQKTKNTKGNIKGIEFKSFSDLVVRQPVDKDLKMLY